MTSTQGTSKEEQDMNMQFTHAVEMTKDDMAVAMTKEEVKEKNQVLFRNFKKFEA